MDDEQDVTGRPPGRAGVRPADRYGDTRPPWHRTAARTGVAALAVVALAWVVWAGLHAGNKDVRWTDIGFSVTSSSQVQVTFDVTKDPQESATCRLEALNRQYAVVGVTEVRVGPSAGRTSRHTEAVTTQEEAVTGLVRSCQVP